jgi:hypothetical protein
MTGSRTSRLSQHTPRLEKLLLMLSSDHDGEVLSAARAIGRTLQTAGADWHDLTGLLAAPGSKPQSKKPRDDDSDNDWRAMREFCLRHRGLLRARELEFVTSLADWRGELTHKQHEWLTAIYERLQRRAA